MSCVGVGAGFNRDTICNHVVEGMHTYEEKEKILHDYYLEGRRLRLEVPVDDEARNRGFRNAVGMLFGLSLAAAGIPNIQDRFRRGKFK